jgi:hypothetical protein
MTPDEPDRTPILASDAERERVVGRLREAVGEGRLTLEEFSERVGIVQTARTDTDLEAVARDLPPAQNTPVVPAAATPAAPAAGALEPAGRAEYRAICSHLVRSGPWSLPPRSQWRSYFGTIDLDLREARLSDADTRLELYNLFGTITVIVPEGIEVSVTGGGVFASQKVEAPARPPVAGGVRLTIDCRGPGGTVYVRTRPKTTLKGLITGER